VASASTVNELSRSESRQPSGQARLPVVGASWRRQIPLLLFQPLCIANVSSPYSMVPSSHPLDFCSPPPVYPARSSPTTSHSASLPYLTDHREKPLPPMPPGGLDINPRQQRPPSWVDHEGANDNHPGETARLLASSTHPCHHLCIAVLLWVYIDGHRNWSGIRVHEG